MKNNHCCSRLQLSALAIVGLFYSLQASAVDYTITDLGTLGGNVSVANAINNSGQVTGSSNPTGSTDLHPFIYNNGVMTDLGTIRGPNNRAYDINNNGQVVGTAYSAGDTDWHAFLYSNGSKTDLGTLGGSYSGASGINDSGQVVGFSYKAGNSNSTYTAFIYNNGVMTDLGGLGGISYAYDINNNGQIVGMSQYTPGNWNAVLWSNGKVTDLGLGLSKAYGINNNGQVVGEYNIPAGGGITHAFFYSNGTMTDLGALGGINSAAYDVNVNGQVVGRYYVDGDAVNSRAFLYTNGAMSDLNSLLNPTSGWELLEAKGINDLGQVVGYGTINGQYHAYLMTPTSVVPIPAAFWLFGSGVIGLLGFMRGALLGHNNTRTQLLGCQRKTSLHPAIIPLGYVSGWGEYSLFFKGSVGGAYL